MNKSLESVKQLSMLAHMAGVKMEDGSVFNVDFIRWQLSDTTIPGNVIPIAKMIPVDGGYTFKYDPDTRNIATPERGIKQGAYYVRVRELTRMQPEFMAFLYGIPEDAVKGKTDRQFLAELPEVRRNQAVAAIDQINFELFEKRRDGILPEVLIGDERFILKWDEKLMYSLRNPDLKIDFTRLRLNSEMDKYYCFFDLISKEPIYEPKVNDYNDRLGLCVLPDEAYLDPVGVARSRGFQDIDLLAMFPLVERTIAQVFQVHELGFAKERKQARNVRNAIRRVNRRRGKGL